MIRIAAVGDLQFAEDALGTLAPRWRELSNHADVLILAGDLTNIGSRTQACALAAELAEVTVPIGHVHHSAERGVTPRGVPVRSVAMPLLKRPYGLYCLDASGLHSAPPRGAGAVVPVQSTQR